MIFRARAFAQDIVSRGDRRKTCHCAGATSQAPTYLRDVQPIFMGNCSRCHNQQTRFVYNWLDYKTAYADRWEIRRRIWDSWKGSYYKEAMPIANSPESLALTDEQRLTIRNWVDSGGLRGVAPASDGAKTKAERIELGRRLFTICAACHQPTGRGLPNMFPPLAGSDFLNADKNRAIKIVIHGRQGEVVVNGMKFNNNMPSFPLSDQDIANVSDLRLQFLRQLRPGGDAGRSESSPRPAAGASQPARRRRKANLSKAT